jgi:amidase
LLLGLKKDALKGVRIGAPWNLNGSILYVAGNQFPTNVLSTYIQAIKDLESVGATVVNMTLHGYQEILNTNHTYVFSADFRCNIRDYLATLKKNPQNVRNLADLVAFNDDHPELEEPATYDHQDE